MLVCLHYARLCCRAVRQGHSLASDILSLCYRSVRPGHRYLSLRCRAVRPGHRYWSLCCRSVRPGHRYLSLLQSSQTRPQIFVSLLQISQTRPQIFVSLLQLLLVGCLTSQQHASVSQGRICSDNFTCCHIEIEVADQTLHLTQSQYTDTGPTIPSADPITPGAWQGIHWSANF